MLTGSTDFSGSASWYAGFGADVLARFNGPLTLFFPSGWVQQGGVRAPGIELRVLDDYRENVVYLDLEVASGADLERCVVSLAEIPGVDVLSLPDAEPGRIAALRATVHDASWSDVGGAPDSALNRVMSTLPLPGYREDLASYLGLVSSSADLRATRAELRNLHNDDVVSWKWRSPFARDMLIGHHNGHVLELWPRLAPHTPWLLRVIGELGVPLPKRVRRGMHSLWRVDEGYGRESAVTVCSGVQSDSRGSGVVTLRRALADVVDD